MGFKKGLRAKWAPYPICHLNAYFVYNFWNLGPNGYLNFGFRYLDGPKRNIKWGSTKLIDEGFEYKYDANKILGDNIKSARKMGDLPCL